jgi:AraC-like DNA-binding protein
LHAEFTAPWCISAQIAHQDCGSLLDGAEHLVLYHYVVEGKLTVGHRNGPPVVIEAGEVVIFPHNHAHLLGSHIDIPPVHAREIVRVSPEGGLFVISHGGGGERTRIVCGFLGCDPLQGNPLASTLPPLLRYDARQGSAAAWMRSSLEFAADEVAARRMGSGVVLAKLSELLFVEALRHYVEGLPDEQTGWLAGLKDPYVSRALALLHDRVAQQWTVDDLGREVGLSRSALADRFTRLVGEPPMRYLGSWRIQVAAHQLRNSDASLGRIAEQIGYESDLAQGRAHSTFAADALTSAAHFGASAAMKAAKSCGDPIRAWALNLAKLALISGEARPVLIAALTLSTIAAGVPAGASTPVHDAGGKPR